jgi:hypothetical protein
MSSRRDFLRSLPAAAALHASARSILSAQGLAVGEQIDNQFLTARFDAAAGRFHVDRRDGTPLLRNAVARAALGDARRATSDPEYDRSTLVRPYQDALGKGRQLRARCSDRRKQIDFEVVLTLYDGRDAVVVEVICGNTSGTPTRLSRIEPVRAVLEEGAGCAWGAGKALTNGYLYADPGQVEEIGGSNRHAVTSMWNMGFYRGAREEGLVIGYLENDVATGRLAAMYDRTMRTIPSYDALSLTVESLYNVEYVLKPGAATTSGRVIFNIAPDPFAALESYAQAIADVHRVRLNPIINGWCSWFYSHEYISEEEVLRNADVAARALKQYGLEYVQIDAGWFQTYGEWEGNQSFPHGMQWLATRIRESGLRAGLWIAPYCIAEGTDVFERRKDWLLTDREGNPRQCGGGNTEPQIGGGYGVPSLMKKIYGLDVTHPDAAGWLTDLFRRVADQWGYDFIKIDFVEWTLLSADRYHDPGFSKAAAYRKGFEVIRNAVGPKCHLLDCGPMNYTVGLLDSARIELDQPRLTWAQYTANFNSTAPAMAKRYYFNRKTWTNDADHLGLARLTIPQARMAASLIALSGGTVICGDRLVDLDPDRLEILRKVYPSYGVAARPIDLFESDRPECFELPVKTTFADWSVVALLNYTDAFAEKALALDRLRLPATGGCVAFEFWSQRLVGEFDDELKVHVDPQSVALLSIHPRTAIPRVISTDRHFTQGAVELASVTWDGASNTLSGTSLGPPETAHDISVYVPRPYRWDSERPEYFQEHGNYSVEPVGQQLLRVRPRFDTSAATNWQLKFSRE